MVFVEQLEIVAESAVGADGLGADTAAGGAEVFGTDGGDQLGEGGGETPVAQKIALGVGLVLAVVVTVFITRIAKRELAARVDLGEGEA